MFVYCETIYGPQRCKVVKEVSVEEVRLRPCSTPDGPFGGSAKMDAEFVTYKALCWKAAKRLNQYGTRHELSGRPEWSKVPSE